MATYSNLGIQLITTGTESGTWGTITNTNFNYFDTAIVGYGTLTLTTTGSSGAPNDLDVANYAVSTGRNRIVEIYSATDLGGTCYVRITPATFAGYYFIRNNLGGNQSVIISQGTAASTVTLAKGKDIVLRCDGNNNVKVVLDNVVFSSITTDALTSKSGTFTNSTAATTQTANTLSGSTAVTLSGTNVSILQGMRITGTGIPSNTVVANISGTSLTLSNAATSTNSGITLTFYTLAPVTADTLTVYGNVTQNLSMGGYKVVNVAEPTVSTDAATKNYVDTHPFNVNNNAIINGAMQISQRGDTTSAPTGTFIVDRFVWNQSGSGVVNVSQSSITTGLPPSLVGLNNAASVSVTTPDTVLAASDFYTINYVAEGYDTAKFIGNTFTLSFWVRSSNITGVYSVAFRNSAATASYVTTFTINAANTWEYKTITITSGLPSASFTSVTNAAGVLISWCLGAGTGTYDTAPNSWVSANKLVSTTQTANSISNNPSIFEITGVQLELGSAASSFMFRAYGDEFALCQRYYQTYVSGSKDYGPSPYLYGYNAAGGAFYITVSFNTTMRPAPVVTKVGTWTTSNCSQPVVGFVAAGSFRIGTTVTATGGCATFPSTGDGWTADAEF